MSTVQELQLKWRGLYLHPNPFSEVPEGAMGVADNVVIDRESIPDSRRGFKRYGTALPSPPDVITEFNGALLVHCTCGKLFYDSDGQGTWVDLAGTYDRPATDNGSRVRFVGANQNLYFASVDGVYKMTTVSGNPVKAGAPRGLGGTGVTTGSTGFLPNNTNVAYRIVWGYRDTNNNLILGFPSDRIIVSNNSGGSRNTEITFQIPEGIDTTFFYQIYRSTESADLATEPNDELRQVQEDTVTSAQITAGEISFVDTTPNELRQAFIYTAPSQQGIANGNGLPPYCKDMDVFKQQMVFANTRLQHRVQLNLVSSGPPDGIQVGDTITVTNNALTPVSFTLTAAAAEDVSLNRFQVFSTGDVAADIEATARSIVSIINKSASATFVNAYYISGFNDIPGQILLEKTDFSSEFISVTCTRGEVFAPTVPASGTAFRSENDERVNRVYFSKQQQPEAVPILNYIDVGSANSPIVRIQSLRDGIIVLKPEGVYRIFGDNPSNFGVTLIDNTVNIIAPNSVAVLNNQVWFLSNQGVVSASESSIEVFSRPIEKRLLELTSPITYPAVAENVFSVAYSSDRKFILWLQDNPSSAPQQAFAWNTFTQTWTRWIKEFTCGTVSDSDDRMYYGGPVDETGSPYIWQERKSASTADYADEEYTFPVSAQLARTLTVGFDTDLLRVGDTLIQDSTGLSARIATIVDSATITIDDDTTFDLADITAYRAIPTAVETLQVDCKQPGLVKHYKEVSFIFVELTFDKVDVTFRSGYTNNEQTVPLTASRVGGWGQFSWGALPWGGSGVAAARLRTHVPKQMARNNWIYLRISNEQAFTNFGLAGMSLWYSVMSPRQR